jgi:hypothetical protein
VWDVVGLYVSPPEKAVVLCCDEKSQLVDTILAAHNLSANIQHETLPEWAIE